MNTLSRFHELQNQVSKDGYSTQDKFSQKKDYDIVDVIVLFICRKRFANQFSQCFETPVIPFLR